MTDRILDRIMGSFCAPIAELNRLKREAEEDLQPFTPPPRPSGPPSAAVPMEDKELADFCEQARIIHETSGGADYGYALREHVLRPLALLYAGEPVLTAELEEARDGVESWTCVERRDPGFLPERIGALLPEAWHRLTDEIRRRKLAEEAAKLAPPATVAPAPAKPEAVPTAEPEAKKREYKPFGDRVQRRFADLWRAARIEQGRPPYARDFWTANAEELKKIGVESKRDVERIRDAVSKRDLLPKWNTPRKRRKSGGKRCQ